MATGVTCGISGTPKEILLSTAEDLLITIPVPSTGSKAYLIKGLSQLLLQGFILLR